MDTLIKCAITAFHGSAMFESLSAFREIDRFPLRFRQLLHLTGLEGGLLRGSDVAKNLSDEDMPSAVYVPILKREAPI